MPPYFLIFLFLLTGVLPAPLAFAHGGEIIVTPQTVAQGEPFMATLSGIDIRDVKGLAFDGANVPVFLYKNKPTVLVGVPLAARAGKHTLKLTTLDLDQVKAVVTVQSRPKITAPLGIPKKLGGNTKQSQQNLVAALSKENGALSKIKASSVPFQSERFAFPLKNPEVIDAYGYSRKTGSYSIPHKGVDFRAASGTPVFAINGGVILLAREFTVYGKTVAIDHGGGVTSFSMHLSKVSVKKGQTVERGDPIGLSGESGYALGPHLHLSVRLSGVSIDPMKFFELFGVKR